MGKIKEAWLEFKGDCFKRSLFSRLTWGVASMITLVAAYFLGLNAGHAPVDNPWGNPMGQICSAFSTIGWVSGSFGFVLFTILGLDYKDEEKD